MIPENVRAAMDEAMPSLVRDLPRDPRGWPIPFFVHRPEDGSPPDLRVASGAKRLQAWKQNLCWVCGTSLGRFRVFVGGPYAVGNSCFSDWCCHEKCAIFAVRFCPFINGQMKRRREGGAIEDTVSLAGSIEEAPPLSGLYYVSGAFPLKIRTTEEGHFLPPSPMRVTWWSNGCLLPEDVALRMVQTYVESRPRVIQGTRRV